MNRCNVWSLADIGDLSNLIKAMDNTPSCVNIAGWSYGSGRRRGIARIKNDDSNNTGWHITDSQAFPAPVLHYCAVRGNVAAVIEVIERRADVDAKVNGATADQVALECGFPKVAEVIELARKNPVNDLTELEASETKERNFMEMKAESERQRFFEHFSDGVVPVTVLLREGGCQMPFTLSVPRYISYATLKRKVEEACHQRVLLSFKMSTRPQDMVDTTNPFGDMTIRSGDEMSLSEDYDTGYRILELNNRTTPMFLHMKKPKCTARPLALVGANPAPSPSPSPSMHGSRNTPSPSPTAGDGNTSLVERLKSCDGATPQQRLDNMKKLLQEAERARTNKTRLSPEQREQALRRLYDRSLQSILARRQSHDEHVEEGQRRLVRANVPKGSLSAAEEQSVEKLYSGAMAHREAVAEALEAEAEERAPRPFSVAKSLAEIEEASQRLCNNSMDRKKEKLRAIEESMYGKPKKPKVIPASELGASADNLYKKSVEHKMETIEKLSRQYGDFRQRKRGNDRKLTKDELGSMADRLSKK